MHSFESLHPVLQGLLATIFTYAETAVGASFVFFFKKINQTLIDSMLGFSAGVMIAVSFWSLLSPAEELSVQLGYSAWLVNAAGFICGGIFVMVSDILLTAQIGVLSGFAVMMILDIALG